MRPLDLNRLPKLDLGISELINFGIRRSSETVEATLRQRAAEWVGVDVAATFRGAIPGEFVPANGTSFVVSRFGTRGFARICFDAAMTETLIRLTTGHGGGIDEYDRGFLAVLTADMFDQLAAAGAPKVEVRIEDTPQSNAFRMISFQWEVRFPDAVGTVTWIAGEPWWRAYFSDWPSVGVPAPLGLETATKVSVGTVTLARSTFDRVEVGDVLFPEHGVTIDGVPPTGVGTWIVGDTRIPLALAVDDNRWRCEVSTMDNSTTNKWSDTAVGIDVVVGDVTVALRDLGAIKPGSVLNLDLPVSNHVNLHVNGREFALGELVNLEGRLGVRVLRLSNR